MEKGAQKLADELSAEETLATGSRSLSKKTLAEINGVVRKADEARVTITQDKTHVTPLDHANGTVNLNHYGPALGSGGLRPLVAEAKVSSGKYNELVLKGKGGDATKTFDIKKLTLEERAFLQNGHLELKAFKAGKGGGAHTVQYAFRKGSLHSISEQKVMAYIESGDVKSAEKLAEALGMDFTAHGKKGSQGITLVSNGKTIEIPGKDWQPTETEFKAGNFQVVNGDGDLYTDWKKAKKALKNAGDDAIIEQYTTTIGTDKSPLTVVVGSETPKQTFQRKVSSKK